MLIDIHTHAFHPKIASKAIQALNSSYGVHCEGSGLFSDLEQSEKRAGIDRYTVLCAATAPAQVIPANNYAIRVCREGPDSSIAFGTLHPEFADWEKELDRLERNGIRGLKLHPDFQQFRMDDPKLRPIFEACSGRFIILFHVGSQTKKPQQAPSSPLGLKKIMDNFPKLDVIGAHFGGYQMWSLSLEILGSHYYQHLWMDTSSTTPFVSKADLERLLALYPEDHYFFGTDWPLYQPEEELHRLKKMTGFSYDRTEQLMANASELLDSYGMLQKQPDSTADALTRDSHSM